MLLRSYQYLTFENNNLRIHVTFPANSAFSALNEILQSHVRIYHSLLCTVHKKIEEQGVVIPLFMLITATIERYSCRFFYKWTFVQLLSVPSSHACGSLQMKQFSCISVFIPPLSMRTPTMVLFLIILPLIVLLLQDAIFIPCSQFVISPLEIAFPDELKNVCSFAARYLYTFCPVFITMK